MSVEKSMLTALSTRRAVVLMRLTARRSMRQFESAPAGVVIAADAAVFDLDRSVFAFGTVAIPLTSSANEIPRCY